ncbi:hypothetical protein BDA96_02G099000 [Sorghum bicolor]|uniref:Uncharacterized protein n=2 Tax=Sorghum bicolor TaxID=4558 RepID=A0A921RL19_SORBI|nr:hypothetical protein BDA96_02G099000 [Sorghum bicolor]OQU88788.1 hypothetical protein SORBI_3002G096101 [Sorghum bicolor]
MSVSLCHSSKSHFVRSRIGETISRNRTKEQNQSHNNSKPVQTHAMQFFRMLWFKRTLLSKIDYINLLTLSEGFSKSTAKATPRTTKSRSRSNTGLARQGRAALSSQLRWLTLVGWCVAPRTAQCHFRRVWDASGL